MFSGQFDSPEQVIQAKSLEECKRKLYTAYGNAYEIRDHRLILKGGFFGLRQKELVEVTYVLRKNPRTPNAENSSIDSSASTKATVEDVLRLAANAAIPSSEIFDEKFEKLENSIMQKFENLSTNSEKHSSIKKIEELLQENEFTASYIAAVNEMIRSNFSLEELDDFKAVERKVVDWIGHSISIAPVRTPRPPHTIVIVGPTGVGKTTTLVKLAAKMVRDSKENGYAHPEFCFITMDSIRVGAFEQLDRYSELFETTLQKAESLQDLQSIYKEKKDSVDVIFIDMSGCSPNDIACIASMQEKLQVRGLHPDIYLALSAGTKTSDLENIIKNYEPFGYNSVIVTKWDESKQYGNIISVLSQKRKSISYITDGQQVVGGIHRPSVVEFLINLSDFNIDRIHIEDEFGED